MKDYNYFQDSLLVSLVLKDQMLLLNLCEDEQMLKRCIRIGFNTFYPELPEPSSSMLDNLLKEDKKFLGITVKTNHLSYKDQKLLKRIMNQQPMTYLFQLLQFPKRFINLYHENIEFVENELVFTINMFDKVSGWYRNSLKEKGIYSPGLQDMDQFMLYLIENGLIEAGTGDGAIFYQSALSFLIDSYFGDYFKAKQFDYSDKLNLVQAILFKLFNLDLPFIDYDIMINLTDIVLGIVYPDLLLESEYYVYDLYHKKERILKKDGKFIILPVEESTLQRFKRLLVIDTDFDAYFIWDIPDENTQFNELKRLSAIFRVIALGYASYLKKEMEILAPVLIHPEQDFVMSLCTFTFKNYKTKLKNLRQGIARDYMLRPYVVEFIDIMNDVVSLFYANNPLTDLSIVEVSEKVNPSEFEIE